MKKVMIMHLSVDFFRAVKLEHEESYDYAPIS
jgi:hypothetical protein